MAKTTPVRRRSPRSPRQADTAAAPATRDSAKAPAAGAARITRRPRTLRQAGREGAGLPKGVSIAVAAAQDKKAEDLVVMDLRKAGGFTDYFLICTGANARQIMAIADAIRDALKRELDERPAVAEGLDRAEWVLLDYFDFVVHVFSRDYRSFYNLERLWGNAERVVPAT
jgi:ribosome-associated protein